MKQKNKKIIIIIFFDILMIIILWLNLSWIVFDWVFSMSIVSDFFKTKLTDFYTLYQPVHENFLYYDLIFVAVFSLEVIIRWFFAIAKKTYSKWFFYPIIHWYDVLGTVPVGGFLLLRFIRIFSIIYRLNKLKIIDIKKTYIYKKANKYQNIIVEEISDRVVVNILSGVQDELKSETFVTDRIIDEIILPNKDILTDLISEKVSKISTQVFDHHQEDLEKYINKKVSDIFRENKDAKKIKKIPVVGHAISLNLQKSINDIIINILESIISDIASEQTDAKIKQIAGSVFESLIVDAQKDTDSLIQNVVIDAIEIIKDQVKVQQWKIKEIKELETKLKANNSPKVQQKLQRLLEQKKQELFFTK